MVVALSPGRLVVFGVTTGAKDKDQLFSRLFRLS